MMFLDPRDDGPRVRNAAALRQSVYDEPTSEYHEEKPAVTFFLLLVLACILVMIFAIAITLDNSKQIQSQQEAIHHVRS